MINSELDSCRGYRRGHGINRHDNLPCPKVVSHAFTSCKELRLMALENRKPAGFWPAGFPMRTAPRYAIQIRGRFLNRATGLTAGYLPRRTLFNASKRRSDRRLHPRQPRRFDVYLEQQRGTAVPFVPLRGNILWDSQRTAPGNHTHSISAHPDRRRPSTRPIRRMARHMSSALWSGRGKS